MSAPATVGAAPALEARKLTKVYGGRSQDRTLALLNVDITIADGEFVSVVGPSGCGKSTFMKIVAGLIEATSGTIAMGGRPVVAGGAGGDVGVVFQQPVLLPWRTILQNVLVPSEVRRAVTPAVRERARALLATVGLAGFENRYPYQLSGGMQQRAAIVRALVHEPRLLLMDEPFGALDAMTREQMNEEVLRIWHASHKTVIFITHSISEAVFLSDRVMVMTPRPGRLAAVIDIDLPRPRRLEMINTDRFGVYVGLIRNLLNAREDIAG